MEAPLPPLSAPPASVPLPHAAPTAPLLSAAAPAPWSGAALASIPRVPALLGFGGLLPFAALAVAHVARLDEGLGLPPGAARGILLAYALAILSFLGGVRWGLGLAWGEKRGRDRLLVGSVIPALVGWVGALMPPPIDFWILAGAFTALGAADMRLPARAGAPAWYAPLRLGLTAGVVFALVAAVLVGG